MAFLQKSGHLVVWLINVHLSYSLFFQVEQSNVVLPIGIASSTAVYDGKDSVFILGGWDTTHGGRAGVYKYSISDDTVQKVNDMGDLANGDGVWTGNNEIHYFGYDKDIYLTRQDIYYYNSAVWRIDPTDIDNRIIVHNLTNKMYDNAVVWDGAEFIYSFGGMFTENITLKYSKNTNSLTEYQNLFKGRYHSSAIWDDVLNKAYIFGGSSNGGEVDEILEFDPVSNTARKLDILLANKTTQSCSVWTGTRAYILGGYRATLSSRFTPSTETIEPIELVGWSVYDIQEHSCAYIPKVNRIYIFGGFDLGNNRISYIQLMEEETPTTTEEGTPTTTEEETPTTTEEESPTTTEEETPTTTEETSTIPPEDSNMCQDEETGTLLRNPECCTSYYVCLNGLPLIQSCPSLLQFHPNLKKCEDKGVVKCDTFYHT